MAQTPDVGPKDHGYLRQNNDGSWTAVAVVQERVSDGTKPTYTVLPEEMPGFAQTMIGGCLRVEHSEDTFSVGQIDNAWASYQTVDAAGAVVQAATPQRMMAELRIIPTNPVATYVVDQVLDGKMQGVSLGMEAANVQTPDGRFGRELTFKELSMVFRSDIPGSRLLPFVDGATGKVYESVGAVPQTMHVCASASKKWRVPQLNPKTKSTTWLVPSASDSKTVLCGRLTFKLTASASSKPPTYFSMATPTQTTTTTNGTATPETTAAAVATTSAVATPATPAADAQLQAKYDALAAKMTQMQNDETVRVFWEKYGVALKALNTGASTDDSDLLTQAIANPASVLDEGNAAILRGMAMGYDRANQLVGGTKRSNEDLVGVVAGANASGEKRMRLSDAEAALRARFGAQAAQSSAGTDYQQAWNQRVQQNASPSVVDPVTGTYVKPADMNAASFPAFNLDWLVAMAAAPERFVAPVDIELVASALSSDVDGILKRCAKEFAVDLYTGRAPRRVPTMDTVAPPTPEDRHIYRVMASAGGFVL